MKTWEEEFREFCKKRKWNPTSMGCEFDHYKKFCENLLLQSRKEWDEKWRESIRNKKWYKEIANDIDMNFIVKDEAVLKAEMGWEKLMSEKIKLAHKEVLEGIKKDLEKILSEQEFYDENFDKYIESLI
ncbi:MAG TPA: hypothetical protein VK255_02995 [Patescibacteria group bacterium]|nr:hypothetical protein [Patescibacteria group bacterium]